MGKRVMVMEVPGKRRKTEAEVVGYWITSRKTCRRANCQGTARKTELNGAEVSHNNN